MSGILDDFRVNHYAFFLVISGVIVLWQRVGVRKKYKCKNGMRLKFSSEVLYLFVAVSVIGHVGTIKNIYMNTFGLR